MNDLKKVTSRKRLAVVREFYNGFAQHVLELEDGTTLYISYGDTDVEIVTTEKMDPEELPAFLNSFPEDQ